MAKLMNPFRLQAKVIRFQLSALCLVMLVAVSINTSADIVKNQPTESTKLSEFEWANPKPFGYNFNDITFNGSQFVAVGDNGVIAHLSNQKWEFIEPVTKNNLRKVIWTGTKYYAIGDNGTVVISHPSGWISLDKNGQIPTSENLNDIIWTGSKAYIVGDNGTLLFSSPSGWHSITLDTSVNLNKIIWTGTRLVAIGDEGVLVHNYLTANWIVEELSYWKFDLTGIVWTGIDFAIVGKGGFVLRWKPGGIIYSNELLPNFEQPVTQPTTLGPYGNFTDITYYKGQILAVSDNGYVVYSRNDFIDRYDTKLEYYFGIEDSLNAAYFVNGTDDMLILGNEGVYFSGNHGVDWVRHGFLNVPSGHKGLMQTRKIFTAGAYGGGVMHIVGKHGLLAVHVSPYLNLFEGVSESISYDGFSDLVFADGKYIVFHRNPNYLGTSWNGHEWDLIELTQNEKGNEPITSAVWNGEMFVGIGGFGSFYTSEDAVTWILHDQKGKLNSIETLNDRNDITIGDGLFVAVGEGGIFTSNDGKDWIKRSSVTSSKVLFNNGIYVAAGIGGISRSDDGISWELVVSETGKKDSFIPYEEDDPSPELMCSYVNNFVVVYDDNLYVSATGTDWTIYEPSYSLEHIKIQGIYCDDKVTVFGYIGTSNIQKMLSSTDFNNWNLDAEMPNVPAIRKAIKGDNGEVIMIGDYGTILTKKVQNSGNNSPQYIEENPHAGSISIVELFALLFMYPVAIYQNLSRRNNRNFV